MTTPFVLLMDAFYKEADEALKRKDYEALQAWHLCVDHWDNVSKGVPLEEAKERYRRIMASLEDLDPALSRVWQDALTYLSLLESSEA